MTVRDLKDKLDSMDDNFMVTLQSLDGTQREITDASQQGKHLIFWAD